jgi:predicted nucleic acid-binding protein
VSFFERWRRAVVSTEAVLTEATHLLARVPGGPMACCNFFLEGGAVLVPSTAASLRRCRDLIHEYRDRPMDFADATLVVLAEELQTQLVFTTDRRDFGVYRIDGKKRFTIKP